jgi:hypothetical protein
MKITAVTGSFFYGMVAGGCAGGAGGEAVGRGRQREGTGCNRRRHGGEDAKRLGPNSNATTADLTT